MSKQVIIKKYGEKRTIWLSEAMVVEHCGVDSDYLRVVRVFYKNNVSERYRGLDVLPQTGKAWRWAKIDGRFYYDYENIPNREPKMCKDKLPSEDALLRMGNMMVSDAEAVDLAIEKLKRLIGQVDTREAMAHYMYVSGMSSNSDKLSEAVELSEAWATLKVLWQKSLSNGWISIGLESRAGLIKAGTKLLVEKPLKGLKISNENGLRNKIAEFAEVLRYAQNDNAGAKDDKSEEYNFFVHGGKGNNNSLIVGKTELVDTETGELLCVDVHHTLIYGAYMNRMNAAKEHKERLYEKYYVPTMERLGYRAVSYRTFCFHTDTFVGKMKTASARHGFDYFNKKYQTYVPAKALEYSHSMMVMDGSGLKLMYNYNGKPATLYMNRCYDVASGYLVGYSLHPNHKGAETVEHIKSMLRMVLKNTDGHGAFELLTDNGSAYQKEEMQAMFRMVFGRVRSIAPGNSQENPAEMYNRLLNELAREFWNYAGQYQAKNIEYKANTDGVRVNDLPDLGGAYSQAMQMVEEWNAQVGVDGLSRKERFEQRKHPELKRLDERVVRYVKGNRTHLNLALYRGFVPVEHKGIVREFVLDDWLEKAEMINKALGWGNSLDVEVVWDENMADIYVPNGAWLCEAKAVEKAHKSWAEATEESEKSLGMLTNRKIDVETHVSDFVDTVDRGLEVIRYAQHDKVDEIVISEAIDYNVLKISGKAKEDSNEQYEQQYNKSITGAYKALLDTF